MENGKVFFYQFTFDINCFRRHIEVHGRPTPAVFRNKPHQGGKNSFRLIWTVDSYSRIEEYRLLYRQIKPFHPVSPSQNLTLQSMMYVKLTQQRFQPCNEYGSIKTIPMILPQPLGEFKSATTLYSGVKVIQDYLNTEQRETDFESPIFRTLCGIIRIVLMSQFSLLSQNLSFTSSKIGELCLKSISMKQHFYKSSRLQSIFRPQN